MAQSVRLSDGATLRINNPKRTKLMLTRDEVFASPQADQLKRDRDKSSTNSVIAFFGNDPTESQIAEAARLLAQAEQTRAELAAIPSAWDAKCRGLAGLENRLHFANAALAGFEGDATSSGNAWQQALAADPVNIKNAISKRVLAAGAIPLAKELVQEIERQVSACKKEMIEFATAKKIQPHHFPESLKPP